MFVESMWLRAHAPFQISFTHSAFFERSRFKSIQLNSNLLSKRHQVHVQNFFLGGGCGVTVMEKRKLWQGG